MPENRPWLFDDIGSGLSTETQLYTSWKDAITGAKEWKFTLAKLRDWLQANLTLSGAVEVTLANGTSYNVPQGRLIVSVSAKVTSPQDVTVETASGLEDILYAPGLAAGEVYTSSVGLDTQNGAIDLRVVCTTSVTLKIFLL